MFSTSGLAETYDIEVAAAIRRRDVEVALLSGRKAQCSRARPQRPGSKFGRHGEGEEENGGVRLDWRAEGQVVSKAMLQCMTSGIRRVSLVRLSTWPKRLTFSSRVSHFTSHLTSLT